MFDDPTMATAIIARLFHHSIVIKIPGKSYRIKDLVIDDQSDTSDRN